MKNHGNRFFLLILTIFHLNLPSGAMTTCQISLSTRVIDFQRYYHHVINTTQIEDIQVKRKSQAKAEESIIEQFVLHPYRMRVASHNVHNNDCDVCGRSLHAKRTFHELRI